jgi:hypothetical protein
MVDVRGERVMTEQRLELCLSAGRWVRGRPEPICNFHQSKEVESESAPDLGSGRPGAH